MSTEKSNASIFTGKSSSNQLWNTENHPLISLSEESSHDKHSITLEKEHNLDSLFNKETTGIEFFMNGPKASVSHKSSDYSDPYKNKGTSVAEAVGIEVQAKMSSSNELSGSSGIKKEDNSNSEDIEMNVQPIPQAPNSQILD